VGSVRTPRRGLEWLAARQRGVGWVSRLTAVRSFRELGRKALVRQSLRISAHGQRLGIAILAVLSFAVLVIGPGTKPASASSTASIRNYQTGLCLASDPQGQVYTETCDSGNASQTWIIGPTASSAPNQAIQNEYSGLWLDSNSAGALYTGRGNGGANQSWVVLYPNNNGVWAFQDVATGRWLDSNYGGAAYTNPGNGGAYQSWYA
jgi:hypothetical protein